jgi:ketosteroid isomerase-like protein
VFRVVYVVRNGLITEVREYIDTLYLTRALIEEPEH